MRYDKNSILIKVYIPPLPYTPYIRPQTSLHTPDSPFLAYSHPIGVLYDKNPPEYLSYINKVYPY